MDSIPVKYTTSIGQVLQKTNVARHHGAAGGGRWYGTAPSEGRVLDEQTNALLRCRRAMMAKIGEGGKDASATTEPLKITNEVPVLWRSFPKSPAQAVSVAPLLSPAL